MKICIVFYSRHGGSIQRIAEAVAEGAQSVVDSSVTIFRAADRLPPPLLYSPVQAESKAYFELPIVEVSALAAADAVIFGTSTTRGEIDEPMRDLLEQAGPLWIDRDRIGKVGSVFVPSTPKSDEHKTTLNRFHEMLLGFGMILVGIPYSEKQILSEEYVDGRRSYGESAAVGVDGFRQPGNSEIGIARFQGQYVAEITSFLIRGRAGGKGCGPR